MKGVKPELLQLILHTGGQEVNVEAIRLRNQILKHLCMTPKWPCQSSVRTACLICIILMLVHSHHQAASHSWPEGHRLMPREAGTADIKIDPKDHLLTEIYVATA